MVATLRNEGPWLLEWIAHNKAIGFDAIVVASNDCTDGTDAMLDRLQELGTLRHIENRPPFTPKNIQLSAYAKARATPEVAGADWIMPLDADEFLNIHLGSGRVQDLVASLPREVEAIPVSWRLFGTSGLRGLPEGSVCESYTLAASGKTNLNYVKVLFRNHQRFPILKVHAPHVLDDTPEEALFDCIIMTPSGLRLPERALTTKGRQLTRLQQNQTRWDVAQINHYITKTPEQYVLKKLRGNAVLGLEAAPVLSRAEFAAFNQNQETDLSIRRSAEARNEVLDQLMGDPRLRELHERAVESLHKRLSKLSAAQSEFLQEIRAEV